jgi:hypothetical protein
MPSNVRISVSSRLLWFSIFATILGAQEFHSAIADEAFQYFDHQEIDYWNKGQPTEPLVVRITSNPISRLPEKLSGQFPWQKYLNPKNDEFFREGDYTPPAPFMEIARNPSDENIANWFRYLQTKNEITRRLQEKLQAYAGMNGQQLASAEPVRPLSNSILAPDAKRFRLRLYFDSKCPHCQHMLDTVKELSQMGFLVELRQIDQDLSIRARIPFPVTNASPEELKQYQIDGVPLLLVGDLSQGTFFKIQGYQSTHSVLQALQGAPKSKLKGDQS